jgi:hypothetical protein
MGQGKQCGHRPPSTNKRRPFVLALRDDAGIEATVALFEGIFVSIP